MDGDDNSVSARTELSSFVNVQRKVDQEPDKGLPDNDEEIEDDVLDVNAIDWDNQFTPLHHAILHGHSQVVRTLVSEFGADVLLP